MSKFLKIGLLVFCLQITAQAHQVTFLNNSTITPELKGVIVRTLEQSCQYTGFGELQLTEVLSKIYCNYVTKWCIDRGFLIFDTRDGQTVVVQYEENSIDKILSNSDSIICK